MPDNNILKYYYNNIVNPNNKYEIPNVGVPQKINDKVLLSNLYI